MAEPNRRHALTLLGASALGATVMSRQTFADTANTRSATLIANADVCVITPETTAGPFYFDPGLVRSDIVDGRFGLPLRLTLQVVDLRCQPLADTRLDIWQCDAQGLYSGYPDQPGGISTVSAKFLRGTQFSGADGVVRFDTIYPGWYPGRTPHIHFRAFVGARATLTGQIFFEDEVSDRIYAEHREYARREPRRTRNSNDGIALRAGSGAFAQLRKLPEALEAGMIIGVGG